MAIYAKFRYETADNSATKAFSLTMCLRLLWATAKKHQRRARRARRSTQPQSTATPRQPRQLAWQAPEKNLLPDRKPILPVQFPYPFVYGTA